ncbi:glycosyltransferase [Bizionia sp.]|uniref:glycosyltransferase n=1 Tax=Bizionia sp. TaxID=1954480 RepID=UPI003A9441BB
MDKPLVSVRLMVYNNEPYIREAVESILMQETNFKVEIVVGDDFSTDNTLEIIKSYADTPNIYFKILERPIGGAYWKDRQRLGRLHNFVNIMDNCQGKYIALLDGDDYWTDPLKLQKQVDFLELNQEYVISSHNAKIINEKGLVIQERKLPDLSSNKEYSALDLRKGAFLLTLTLVFRNVIKEFPREFYKVNNGDKFLISLLGNNGKGIYIESIQPAMYRVHGESIWSKLSQREKLLGNFKSYNLIKEYQKKKNNFETVKHLDNHLRKISKDLFLNIDSETKLKNYFFITYYYIKLNKVFQSYSQSKNLVKVSLKHFYKILVKNMLWKK